MSERKNAKGETYVPKYAAQFDYKKFTDKFMKLDKATTDECMTPPAVYDAVLKWFQKRYPELKEKEIVRPFFPGGDFESFEYPPGCAVVDNPPFSMTAKIVRFYVKREIPFVLFCHGLTCGHHLVNTGCGVHLCNTRIVYENGAHVSTAFLVRGFRDMNLVECDQSLVRAVKAAMGDRVFRNRQKSTEASTLARWRPPMEYCLVSQFATLGENAPGGVFKVGFDEGVPVEYVGAHGFFGGGVLLRRAKCEERRAILAARDARLKTPTLTDVEMEYLECGMPDGAYVTDSCPRLVRRGREKDYPAVRNPRAPYERMRKTKKAKREDGDGAA